MIPPRIFLQGMVMFKKLKENIMQDRKPKINLELGEKEGEGIYSNLVVIAYSSAEFILDFARMLPGNPKAKIHSRIIMTPQHAKGLLKTLETNINKFENQFGEIKVYKQQLGEDKVVGFRAGEEKN
jgi:hypothetical protein